MEDFINRIKSVRKLLVLLATVVSSCTFLSAQETQTMTAIVTRTKHHSTIATNLSVKGKFYFKQPGKMCLAFDDGKEMLLMDGKSFIMIKDGKSSVAKGKDANHLAVLQQVLQNIISGGDGMIDAPEGTDMKIAKQDNVISIVPAAANEKTTRRMMFTSFTLTVDAKTSQLKSMCMNEKGGNYTQYDFTGHVPNDTVSDDIFNPGA